MKIILLKDVAGIGRKYDVKEVSDGFARNKLFPIGAAEIATPKAIAALADKKSAAAGKKTLSEALLRKNIETISEKTIEIKSRANEQAHLFAKIHAKDIEDAIRTQYALIIPKEHITLDTPIDQIGTYIVGVSGTQKKAYVTVTVLPQ